MASHGPSKTDIALALTGALTVLLSLSASTAAFADGYGLNILSSRADTVSGGDALVQLSGPSNSSVSVSLNGKDVTSSFHAGPNGMMLGRVEGLKTGKNTLEAKNGGKVEAKLEIVDYPITGPVFSGPHQTPFICETNVNGLGPAQDSDCSAKTIVTYYYKSREPVALPTGAAPAAGPMARGFKSYDPTAPRPADVAKTTISDGKSVDYIVRREIGTINRAVYDIEFLHQPGTPLPTPWNGATSGWNGRLVYTFGGSCIAGYRQGRLAPIGTGPAGITNEPFLSQGYAIATSTQNVFGNTCNDRISAETLSMVKEYFVKEFGAPIHTIGAGGSGGSMQLHLIAQNYPGLLDGILPSQSYPDIISVVTPVTDCSLLDRAFKSSKENWTEDQKTAVAGFATWQTCAKSWFASTFSPNWVVATSCNAVVPKDMVYDAANNPKGARCDLYDNEVNVFGRDPKTGFARRPLDNVGVQYGLVAFNAGKISAEQFVDLNEKAGGYDNDGNIVASRSVADPEALRIAYQNGVIDTGGGGLGDVPIIDFRPYVDTTPDIHDRFRSFVTRARLKAANGNANNQVILIVPGGDTTVSALAVTQFTI